MNEEKNIPPESDKPQGSDSKPDAKIELKNEKNELSEIKKQVTAKVQPAVIETSADKTETTNMEVHKHPHHVTQKKKWGEYLLEFLMIFLAVTLGFIAETIREHTTEQKRAKEFAISMLKDLQRDTIQLRQYKEYFDDAANNIDTLMQLLIAAEPKDIPTGKLYWYGLWGGARRFFIPNDATLQQMKSSGTLRYFQKSVATNVARYDRFCRLLQNVEEKQQGVYVEVRKYRAQIFDFRYNEIANAIAQGRRHSRDYIKLDSFVKTNPPLLNFDKTLFNQYIELVRSRFIRTSNIATSDSLLNSASVLIQDLKKEYGLDDE